MEVLTNEVLGVLSFLLPGFISAWIFYGLTSYPKPTQFERIVQALIFTMIAQACVVVIRWLVHVSWNENISLVVSVAVAILIGLFLARLSNNDRLHKLLRYLRFTRETSFPSEWYGVFSQRQTYIVLNLTDGRRLYGWPEEWPSVPGSGYFSIAHAEWLDKDNKRVPATGVRSILIASTEVRYIEFMEIIEKDQDK